MIDHEPYEELISAKLTGDLNEIEDRRLDSHLAGCARCRDTMTAFTEGRRLVAGMRHLAPPRDLDARVRTGIERGAFAQLPWWRRPAAIFTGVAGAAAVVAGALIGLALINARPSNVAVSPSASATASLVASPTASIEPSRTAEPTDTPAPTVTPIPAVALPSSYFALTGPFDNLALHLRDGSSGGPTRALQQSNAVIAASMAPDGDWLAYIVEDGLRGTYSVWLATPAGDRAPISLGQSQPPGILSPFIEQLAWSPDGRYLAFTIIDGSNASDVRLADTDSPEPVAERLTAFGSGVVGSFDSDGNLWVSAATTDPVSYRLPASQVGVVTGLVDPAEAADRVLEGLFQPLVSPDGTKAIVWTGTMNGAEFVQGGSPYLLPNFSTDVPEANSIQLFADLTIGREAFASAAIAWGIDSNAIAVWNVDWRGTPQSPDGQAYPDPLRVYFGRASEAEPINASRTLDRGDIPSGAARIEDVAISPDGVHLAITIRYPLPGDLSAPRADLVIVRRNTGDVPDDVIPAQGTNSTEGWFGPALYPR